MEKTVIGVFKHEEDADTALGNLKNLGYDPKDISIIMKDEKGVIQEKTTKVATGAVSGVAAGGAIGALAGLLVGIGAIVIPGIGGLLIGGPVASALGLTGAAATTATGALTGALTGGLLGGLIGLGLPEEKAKLYEEHIRSGGILIAVPTRIRREEEVAEILSQHGASDLTVVNLPGYVEASETYGAVDIDEEQPTPERRTSYARSREVRRRKAV